MPTMQKLIDQLQSLADDLHAGPEIRERARAILAEENRKAVATLQRAQRDESLPVAIRQEALELLRRSGHQPIDRPTAKALAKMTPLSHGESVARHAASQFAALGHRR